MKSRCWTGFAALGLGVAIALGSAAAPARAQTERRAAASAILTDYEVIRAALAADRASGVAEAARRIAAGARAAQLADVAAAAGRLAAAPAGDLAALRRAFGELSRPLVALLESDPELRRGRHVFECPMADGYGRWIQPTDALQNPYMGSRMLTCGREIEAGG